MTPDKKKTKIMSCRANMLHVPCDSKIKFISIKTGNVSVYTAPEIFTGKCTFYQFF